uniref:Calpain II heavy chain n=1 Tax=Sus scrofa domesticus TaxID=9825 RepID=Q7M386_PIG
SHERAVKYLNSEKKADYQVVDDEIE